MTDHETLDSPRPAPLCGVRGTDDSGYTRSCRLPKGHGGVHRVLRVVDGMTGAVAWTSFEAFTHFPDRARWGTEDAHRPPKRSRTNDRP